MKLQDYLHYYMGCRCVFYLADDDPNGCHDELTHELMSRHLRDPDETMIKPILRRLEDMTEDEAIAIYRISTKTPFLSADKDEYDVTFIKDKGEICAIQVVDLRVSRMYMNVNIEGDILVYMHEQNEEPKICERVAGQHHSTHFLLKQGFDLFSLIDAGLAIDAKTIKP